MKKRVLSIALIAVFLITGVTSVGFAASKNANYAGYGQNGGYLAIGDSITRGLGSTGADTSDELYQNYMQYKPSEIDASLPSKRAIEGAFNTQIAQTVGCSKIFSTVLKSVKSNFYNVALPAQTLRATNNLFGISSSYADRTGYTMQYEADLKKMYGQSGIGGYAVDMAKNANLITVQLGMTDVFYSAFSLATGGGSLVSGGSISTANLIAASNALSQGYAYFEDYFPKLIKKLVELNGGKAAIVIVGTFNPMSGVKNCSFSSSFESYKKKMNNVMSDVANQYSNVYFADISSVKTKGGEIGASLYDYNDANISLYSHPSQNGYDTIRDKILSVLPKRKAGQTATTDPVVKSTDITVNLDNYQSLLYVLVDGKLCRNTEMNGNTLTVHYGKETATEMKVVLFANWRLSVRKYTLTYKKNAYVVKAK